MKFIIEQGGVKFEAPFNGTEVTIGRSKDSDITVHDDRVSGRHFRVKAEGGKVILQDLLSKNGTLVNGEKVEESRELRDGDVICVGTTNLVFKSDMPAPADQQPQFVQPQYAATQVQQVQYPQQQQAPYPQQQAPQQGGMMQYAPPDPANYRVINQNGKFYLLDTRTETVVREVTESEALAYGSAPARAAASSGGGLLLKYKKAALVGAVALLLILVLAVMSALEPTEVVKPPVDANKQHNAYIEKMESALALFENENNYAAALEALNEAKKYVPADKKPALADAMIRSLTVLKSFDPVNPKPGAWSDMLDNLKELEGESMKLPKIYDFAIRKKDWAATEWSNQGKLKTITDKYQAGEYDTALTLCESFPQNSMFTKQAAAVKDKIKTSTLESYVRNAEECMENKDWDFALSNIADAAKKLPADDKWVKEKRTYCENAKTVRDTYQRALDKFNDGNPSAARAELDALKSYEPYENEVTTLYENVINFMLERGAVTKFNEGKAKEAGELLGQMTSSPSLLTKSFISTIEADFKDAAKSEADDALWTALEKYEAVASKLTAKYFEGNVYLKESQAKLKNYKKSTDYDQAEMWVLLGTERYNAKKYRAARAYFEEAKSLANHPEAMKRIDTLKSDADLKKNDGNLLKAKGDKVAALKEYEQAFEMLIPSDALYPKIKALIDELK